MRVASGRRSRAPTASRALPGAVSVPLQGWQEPCSWRRCGRPLPSPEVAEARRRGGAVGWSGGRLPQQLGAPRSCHLRPLGHRRHLRPPPAARPPAAPSLGVTGSVATMERWCRPSAFALGLIRVPVGDRRTNILPVDSKWNRPKTLPGAVRPQAEAGVWPRAEPPGLAPAGRPAGGAPCGHAGLHLPGTGWVEGRPQAPAGGAVPGGGSSQALCKGAAQRPDPALGSRFRGLGAGGRSRGRGPGPRLA